MAALPAKHVLETAQPIVDRADLLLTELFSAAQHIQASVDGVLAGFSHRIDSFRKEIQQYSKRAGRWLEQEKAFEAARALIDRKRDNDPFAALGEPGRPRDRRDFVDRKRKQAAAEFESNSHPVKPPRPAGPPPAFASHSFSGGVSTRPAAVATPRSPSGDLPPSGLPTPGIAIHFKTHLDPNARYKGVGADRWNTLFRDIGCATSSQSRINDLFTYVRGKHPQLAFTSFSDVQNAISVYYQSRQDFGAGFASWQKERADRRGRTAQKPAKRMSFAVLEADEVASDAGSDQVDQAPVRSLGITFSDEEGGEEQSDADEYESDGINDEVDSEGEPVEVSDQASGDESVEVMGEGKAGSCQDE